MSCESTGWVILTAPWSLLLYPFSKRCLVLTGSKECDTIDNVLSHSFLSYSFYRWQPLRIGVLRKLGVLCPQPQVASTLIAALGFGGYAPPSDGIRGCKLCLDR